MYILYNIDIVYIYIYIQKHGVFCTDEWLNPHVGDALCVYILYNIQIIQIQLQSMCFLRRHGD